MSFNSKDNVKTKKDKQLYYAVAIFLIICSLSMFSFHRTTTEQLADNPQGCRYYITLSSLLSNNRGLINDKANVKYIKSRLSEFEKNIHHSKKSLDIINVYKNNYFTVLDRFDVKSIKEVKDDNTILAIASQSYPIIDNYYLDERLYCINPLYFQLNTHKRRILQYNFGGLYLDIPNRYTRILVAFPNDSQLGVFSGFFVNNQTTALETQFETGMPLLTALYVLPKSDFSKIGGYFASVPWGYFGIDSFTDPATRKLLNISGIDIFTVLKSYMSAKKITGFENATPIPSNIRPMFGGDAQSFINKDSYGMAYLANQITYLDINDVAAHEHVIKNYFSQKNERDPKIFLNQAHYFYSNLMGLNSKRDILLEAIKPNNLNSIDPHIPAGAVEIKGIVGPRALFDVDCNRTVCTFVFNVSDAPGWHAYVNDKTSHIDRANFAFMATNVPKGHSFVWFIYQPLSEVLSFFVSIISLIVLIGLGIKVKQETH